MYKRVIRKPGGEPKDVLKDAATDPSLPRTRSVRCYNCNHPEAAFFQVCTQVLFTCCRCVMSSVHVMRKHGNSSVHCCMIYAGLLSREGLHRQPSQIATEYNVSLNQSVQMEPNQYPTKN